MDVHCFLLSVGYAENVDTARPDGQGFRQEVPESLQPTLPLDVRVDKISRCNAFRRQREGGGRWWGVREIRSTDSSMTTTELIKVYPSS